MKKLRVSAVVYTAIRQKAIYPFNEAGVTANPDGTFDMPVTDDVLERLAAIHSDPEIALRILLFGETGKPS